jgi:hypothetical protein
MLCWLLTSLRGASRGLLGAVVLSASLACIAIQGAGARGGGLFWLNPRSAAGFQLTFGWLQHSDA